MDSIITDVKSAIKEKEFSKKKICIVCEENEAEYCIKGIKKNCYCSECAVEQFGEVDVLEKL